MGIKLDHKQLNTLRKLVDFGYRVGNPMHRDRTALKFGSVCSPLRMNSLVLAGVAVKELYADGYYYRLIGPAEPFISEILHG